MLRPCTICGRPTHCLTHHNEPRCLRCYEEDKHPLPAPQMLRNPA